MGKKEYILKKAEEAERQKKGLPEKPYSPFAMNFERMPFGCWVWILVFIAPVIYGALKLIGMIH